TLGTVLPLDEGSLLIDGLDPRHETDRIEVRRRLGYLPQDSGLDGGSRVFDLLDYLAVCKDLGDARTRRHMIGDALHRVGLADRAGDAVADLSGGMKRRVGLAQALLGAPGLLILDEPAAGLDPDERARLRDVVTERRGRATVIVSTHLTSEAAHSDTVVVLDRGAVRFVGTPARLTAAADGRAWVQAGPPLVPVRASWQQADGLVRCLGEPPPGASLVPATLEDGYLLTVDRPVGV
ncbi:MAG: ATP-binding cassette domain-containing protein, partial [Acidimicrobiales bacterium]